MSVVAQDALGSNEDCYSAFVSHDPVVFVEVVVGATCCLEHFAQQEPQGLGVDAVRQVVGSDEISWAGYRPPRPVATDCDGYLGAATDMAQPGSATG